MGQLFWKIFIAFFLALVATGMTVGNLAHWQTSNTYNTSYARLRANMEHAQTQPGKALPADTTSLAPVESFPISLTREVELEFGLLFLSFPPIIMVFCLIWSALFAGVLAWSIAHPIKLLLKHLQQAGQGDLQSQVSPEIGARHDEFAGLGQAFDAMVAHLNMMIKSQASLLHHVSHELRSPLARIQMAVGLLQQSPEHTQSALQRLELESQRMEHMIAELLELFRLQSGVHKLELTRIDLHGLLSEIIADVHYESPSVQIKLVLTTLVNNFYANHELLYRALDNVIRNAVKYAAAYGEIVVRVQTQYATDELLLEVSDQGPGVAADELEGIFKPFVRGRKTTQIEGHGIGLAMTQFIVDAHKGHVTAENLSPHGFKVSLFLPFSKPEETTRSG